MRSTTMFLVAVLALVLAGINPSPASAGTEIEQDEKKIKKYAVPRPDHFDRQRGYCVCHADDRLGVIWFEREGGDSAITVVCATIRYAADGSRDATSGCASDWTPLAR